MPLLPRTATRPAAAAASDERTNAKLTVKIAAPRLAVFDTSSTPWLTGKAGGFRPTP